MKKLINPKATLSFYNFINNHEFSIDFLSAISGEEISKVENITYKYRENLKIVVINSKSETILIRLINGFGEYKSSRKEFKESFFDYSWEVDNIKYKKLYNIALMGFSVRNNQVDLDTEEIIYKNSYMLKTKEKGKEEYYINIDFPKYEKSMESNLDKWIYIFDDIWDFNRNYQENDIFIKALNSFDKFKLSREELIRYESNLAGLRDARASIIYQLCEAYKRMYSIDQYNSLIDIGKLLRENDCNANKISDLLGLPQEIIIHELY